MTDLVEVGRYRTLAEAEQRALVLAAVGIACRVEPTGEEAGLMVSPMDVGRATSELSSYESENAPERRWLPRTGAAVRGIEAALAYAAVLLFFFAADSKGTFAVYWTGLGAAQASLIVEGEWWRTLTALTLHDGAAHLIGNIAFGVVFSLLAAQSLGAGVAWLAIVAAGALGNGINAVLQPPAHTAIGASTAIFGALGILSAHSQRAHATRWRSRVRRWSPVAAGIMLVAWFGMGGAGTDIGAHVAGFAVGAALGFALARLSPHALYRPAVQSISGAAACALVALAWTLALVR